MERAITSNDDPAGATTTQRIGLLGKPCACANAAVHAITAEHPITAAATNRQFLKRCVIDRPVNSIKLYLLQM